MKNFDEKKIQKQNFERQKLRNFEKKNFTFRTKKISKKICIRKQKMLIKKKLHQNQKKKVLGKIFGR